MKLELERIARIDVDCERCGTAFYYPQKINVSARYVEQDEGSKEEAYESLSKSFDRALTRLDTVVRCPSCKKLPAVMKAERRSNAFVAFILLIVFCAVMAGVLYMIATVGLFFYVIAAIVAYGILYCLWMIISYLIGIDAKSIGVIDGQEDSASLAAKALLPKMERFVPGQS